MWWERMRRRSATSTEAVTWEGEGGEAEGGEDQSIYIAWYPAPHAKLPADHFPCTPTHISRCAAFPPQAWQGLETRRAPGENGGSA